MSKQRSFFIEYVAKWFPSLARIVEKVNGKRAEKLTYLHKTMLRQEFSVDGKWESASVDTTFVAADIVAMDSPLPLKKRDRIQAANGDLPKLGMRMQMNEKEIETLNIMIARGGQHEEIAKKLTRDAVKCVTGIDERNEAVFQQGLSDGVVLVEDEKNVGAGIRVDFGYKDENKFGVTVAWNDTANATPISDIKKVIEASDNNVSVVMLSKRAYDLMRTSEEAKRLAANNAGVLVLENSILATPLPDAFNAAFLAETGCYFIVVDRTVKIEIDGEVTSYKPWNTNKVILLPTEDVGALVYSRLAEETVRVAGVEYTKANAYTLVSKYATNEPSLAEFTTSQAKCLPVIENVDQIYQMDITQAGTQGAGGLSSGLLGASAPIVPNVPPSGIELFGKEFDKATVIAACKEIGASVNNKIGIPKLTEHIGKLSDEQKLQLQEILIPE